MYIGTLPRSQTRLYLEYRQAGQFLNVDLCARCNHHRIDIRTRLNLWPLAEPTATFSADIVIRSGTNREIILTTGAIISRLVVFSDNTNTVAILNSLCAKPEYNSILKSAVGLLLSFKAQLRVLHIPGSPLCGLFGNQVLLLVP